MTNYTFEVILKNGEVEEISNVNYTRSLAMCQIINTYDRNNEVSQITFLRENN